MYKDPSQRWMFPQDAEAWIEDRMPAIYTIVADRPVADYTSLIGN